MKCPRCRRGPMFNNNNPWRLKKVFDMPKRCPECNQPYELEVGFWYGTGYVSYGGIIINLFVCLVYYNRNEYQRQSFFLVAGNQYFSADCVTTLDHATESRHIPLLLCKI